MQIMTSINLHLSSPKDRFFDVGQRLFRRKFVG